MLILCHFWLLLSDNTKVNTGNDGDDEKNNHTDPEADPFLFSCRSRTVNLWLASKPKYLQDFTLEVRPERQKEKTHLAIPLSSSVFAITICC